MTRTGPHVCATAVAAALALGGCGGGTDVGNPIDIGAEAYDLVGPTAPPAANGRVEVDGAWIVITELRLRPAADCEGDAEIRLAAPIAVDLLAATIPPALRDLAVMPGGYCRLDFKWDGIQGGAPGAPPELGDGSILLTGTRADGTPFVIKSDRDDHLELVARGGAFAVAADTSALLIGIDALTWLTGIDLDAAVVGGDGVIRIDAQNNTALGDVFDANVAGGIRLFEDQDGDSRLDPEEHDDTDVLADGIPG